MLIQKLALAGAAFALAAAIGAPSFAHDAAGTRTYHLTFDGFCDGMNLTISNTVYVVGQSTGCSAGKVDEGFHSQTGQISLLRCQLQRQRRQSAADVRIRRSEGRLRSRLVCLQHNGRCDAECHQLWKLYDQRARASRTVPKQQLQPLILTRPGLNGGAGAACYPPEV